MRAYYDTNTMHVICFSESVDDGDYVEVVDTSAVIKNLNAGMIPTIKDGELFFISDRASLYKRVRERRSLLLEEADAYRNKLFDQSLLNGVEPAEEDIIAVAAYRQQLRDIVETNTPENIVWPKKPWQIK
ncbi:phage tail assembly chaperone [Pseudomonas benzenivorans]|uniref:Phage tail assembly chaperone n=1 Tax=Pseudomonas benzenivorans TaxID=556533 RepID=A0ABZ0PSI2_9PSED|nr:phage tail assembly chaperone [Pseudomonas benzenivorans]WPC03474.1 phage tail assembly chaperone [Pseudomonas benzenivorans]